MKSSPRTAYASEMSQLVPPELKETVTRWNAAGRPAASASTWRRELWEKSGIDVPAELESDPVSRDTAKEFASRVIIDDARTQQEAFVVAMIWGHGPSSYGPFRVNRILQQPGFAEQLNELTATTLESGGVAAYRLAYTRRNAGEPFLAHLGAGFGTKYLYFLTKAQTQTVTPVLDAVATQWFRANVRDVNVQVIGWSYPSRYEKYVGVLHDWGEQLGIAADDVEYMIFAQQQSVRGGNRRVEPWLTESTLSSRQLVQLLRWSLASEGLEADQALNSIAELLDEVRGKHA